MLKIIIISLFFLPGCKAYQLSLDKDKPVEKIFLVYPGIEKKIDLSFKEYRQVDIGIDYNQEAGSVSLQMINGHETLKGTRIPGSSLLVALCKIAPSPHKTRIILHNNSSRSLHVSLRIAPSPSGMCSTAHRVNDDYIALMEQDTK
ncbi:MAG: hypothetical protein PF689_03855 [Deltaproteobacteria bacterium]|jgi:hypothetical protein|nr:hypothetical protein [Deltaproteobacteria bacterium]